MPGNLVCCALFFLKILLGYFIQKFKEIFHYIYTYIYTYIYMCVFFAPSFISFLIYRNYIPPQGVHVTNTWSNLAFWYKENPSRNMLYFGIETGTTKSKYISFARYYISQLNQSYWKRHTCFKRIAARLQGTIWIIMKKLFQTKLYTFPKKELLNCILFQTIMHFPSEASILKKACL